MAALSFKNIGVKKDDLKNDVLRRNQSAIPIGIKTPLELDPFGKEIFAMNYDIKNQS